MAGSLSSTRVAIIFHTPNCSSWQRIISISKQGVRYGSDYGSSARQLAVLLAVYDWPHKYFVTPITQRLGTPTRARSEAQNSLRRTFHSGAYLSGSRCNRPSARPKLTSANSTRTTPKKHTLKPGRGCTAFKGRCRFSNCRGGSVLVLFLF